MQSLRDLTSFVQALSEPSCHNVGCRRRYVSPDAEHPAKGVLAAAAVRALAPYIGNHVHNQPNCLKATQGRENADECVAAPAP